MQITSFPTNTPLPGFRKDLIIFVGPQDDDGSPTYSLYDPVKGQYYKLSWSERMIIAIFRPGMSLEILQQVLRKYTPVLPTMNELQSFFTEAHFNGLLHVPSTSEYLTNMSERYEGSWFWWLLTHYLYIRVPLFKPDKFLDSTVKYAKLLMSWPMIIFFTLVTVMGLGVIITRWEEYTHTFLHFFSFEGLLWYSVGIFFVKVVHELSHAFTAKAYGIKVPSIGVAFIVLWPVLYTDVTHSWRLASRKQRFAISVAGIIAELILAGLATLGWALSQPGIFQSLCYVISTTSLLSTLLINLNPAMRFDGYYLLTDLWGIDNLQDRSFRVARWNLHKNLLGIEAPVPEEDLTKKTIFWMTVYSVYTWLYRISLYTAIALFVYHAFTKLLGFILFLAEILIFLVWPFFLEVKEIIKVKSYFKASKRFYITTGIFTLLLLWFFVPLSHVRSFVGFSESEVWQNVYVPEDSIVKEIFAKRGENVKEGEPLIQLRSEIIQAEFEKSKIDEGIQNQRLKAAQINPGQQANIPGVTAQLDQIIEKKQQLANQLESLHVLAEISGTIIDWNKDLYIGENVPKGLKIGKIADLKNVRVFAFVPEDKVSQVILDSKAEFYIPGSNRVYHGKIIDMQPFRAVNFDYFPLASHFGGDIPVIEKAGKLEIVDSYYIIRIDLDEAEHPPLGQVGYARWRGPPTSYAMDLVRFVHRVLLQESGF